MPRKATRKPAKSSYEARLDREKKIASKRKPAVKVEKKTVKKAETKVTPKKRTSVKPKTTPEKKKPTSGKGAIAHIDAELAKLKGKKGKDAFKMKMTLGRLRKQIESDKE